MPDVESPEENDKMLDAENKIKIIPDRITNESPPKGRKESIRDFLKTLGSISSLRSTIEVLDSTKSGILHQCVATFAILLLTAGAGHPIGFSAILLPQLGALDPNATMYADLEMGSWIASVHSAASPVGSLTAGYMMDAWGRKRTLELSVPCAVLGWLCVAFAPYVAVLMLGRVFCGYGVGYIAAAAQVYLGEISDPWLRGSLIGSPFVSYSIGILITYSLGNLPWRWVAGSGLILPIVAGMMLLKMPESPVWLINNAKITKGHKALKWLRGDELLAKKEMHQIAAVKAKERLKNTNESFFNLMRIPSIYKPLIIINVFNLLQNLSGTYIVIFYAVDIIEDATGSSFNSLEAATYTAVIRLVFAVIGCFLLLRVNRRTLCIASGVGSALASLTLSVYMMHRSGHEKTDADFWTAVACLAVYIASNTLGFMMLPSLMVGELLPEKIRGMWGGYIFMIFNIILFSFTKAYPLIKLGMGSEGLFMVFGVASLVATVFIFLVLPETKGKSLKQIEDYFESSNFLWIANKSG